MTRSDPAHPSVKAQWSPPVKAMIRLLERREGSLERFFDGYISSRGLFLAPLRHVTDCVAPAQVRIASFQRSIDRELHEALTRRPHEAFTKSSTKLSQGRATGPMCLTKIYRKVLHNSWIVQYNTWICLRLPLGMIYTSWKNNISPLGMPWRPIYAKYINQCMPPCKVKHTICRRSIACMMRCRLPGRRMVGDPSSYIPPRVSKYHLWAYLWGRTTTHFSPLTPVGRPNLSKLRVRSYGITNSIQVRTMPPLTGFVGIPVSRASFRGISISGYLGHAAPAPQMPEFP